jgi:hypothetical protein
MRHTSACATARRSDLRIEAHEGVIFLSKVSWLVVWWSCMSVNRGSRYRRRRRERSDAKGTGD